MNNKNNKMYAVFLAAGLMIGVGIIGGISSPSFIAFAQMYEEYEYEEDEYDLYGQDDLNKGKDGKSNTVKYIANCDLSLTNINGLDQEAIVKVPTTSNNNINTEPVLNGQQLTPEEALNALAGNSNGNGAINGNGEPLINLDKNIVNVCLAFNHNEVTSGDFTATQNDNDGGDPANID